VSSNKIALDQLVKAGSPLCPTGGLDQLKRPPTVYTKGQVLPSITADLVIHPPDKRDEIFY
jgi:hypothetical protein